MTQFRPLLELKNITFSYGPGVPVLKAISFVLDQGETLGIIGPNGGGKTTLLKIIVGILRPDQGEILIEGHSGPFTGHSLGYVPQHTVLNDVMPIRVVDLLGFETAHSPFARPPSIRDQRIQEVLEKVGLTGMGHALIASLSGGQRQRVLLARALVKGPKILALDEPFTGLDSTGQDQLISLLRQLQKDVALIIVDHNLNQVLKNSHKIICLNRTSHWHNRTDLLTKNVLESIYHCEFEHILIHHGGGQDRAHAHCEHPPTEAHEHSHSKNKDRPS